MGLMPAPRARARLMRRLRNLAWNLVFSIAPERRYSRRFDSPQRRRRRVAHYRLL